MFHPNEAVTMSEFRDSNAVRTWNPDGCSSEAVRVPSWPISTSVLFTDKDNVSVFFEADLGEEAVSRPASIKITLKHGHHFLNLSWPGPLCSYRRFVIQPDGKVYPFQLALLYIRNTMASVLGS